MMQAAKNKLPKPPRQRPQLPASNASLTTQAIAVERLLVWNMFQKNCSHACLSRLALAWCQVLERIRVLRGVPLPGQLRPDLDPVQLAKALRRQRDRGIHELAPMPMTFLEDAPTEAKPPEQKGEAKTKESLSDKEGGDGTKGDGGIG